MTARRRAREMHLFRQRRKSTQLPDRHIHNNYRIN
jgi:hypothetical protein